VRDLLERNLIPVHWYDVDTDDLADTMSRYPVERLESRRNIEIVTGTEVAAADGDGGRRPRGRHEARRRSGRRRRPGGPVPHDVLHA
jgi:hypothetical protein